MTQRTDIERVLDLWLADGPNHVPDRVFDDAVAAVYRAPQRSPWRLRWRDLKVSTRLLAAAIAVLAIVAVGIALAALGPTSNFGASPSPSVAPTPTPTQAAATDDPSLCQPSEPECTGRLAAGTHSTSAVLAPVRYTVPDGWRKPLDVPGAMNLEADGAPAGTIVAVWPDWQIMSQSDCRNVPEPGLGRGVEDLLAFLVDHPGLVASEPERVVLGDLPGVVLDIRRNPDWSGPCPNAVNLFTHQGTINDVGWQDISGSRVNRLWLLDGPDGHVTNVAIEAPSDQAFETFAAVATPVIESFSFVRETACIDRTSCVGGLLPGSHRAGPPFTITSFGVPLTYEVPEGWANTFNGSSGYALQRLADAGVGQSGIFIFTGVAAASQSTCSMTSEPGVGTTAGDIADWIGTLPGFTQASLREESLGGFTGFAFDLTVTADAPPCASEAKYLVGDSPGLWWGLTPSVQEHVILLDDGTGGNVAIIVEAPVAEWTAFAEAATPIVDSFDFTR